MQPNPDSAAQPGKTDPDPQRNFSTISPSAYALLLMKGYTAIPYAREAAELLVAPQPYTPDFSNPQPAFWVRLLHFENRYWSIDQLMTGLPITNILELSSGFSFRGLALTQQQPVYYIDTDLPELIATKKQFVEALQSRPVAGESAAPAADAHAAATSRNPETPPTPGHYELQPLNVLDEAAFTATIDRFPPGEILIINEGLLVYLDETEKERLCRIIHGILQRRGGYWITADIYTQRKFDAPLLEQNDQLTQFFQQHNIEENKFRDFEAATDFFTRMGFIIDHEAQRGQTRLTALPHLMAAAGPELQSKLRQAPKIQATWRLRVAG